MFDFMGGRGARRPRPSPREEIEDFISDRANYFPRLEAAAEATAREDSAAALPTLEALAERLQHDIGVTVTRGAARSRAAERRALRGRGESADSACRQSRPRQRPLPACPAARHVSSTRRRIDDLVDDSAA